MVDAGVPTSVAPTFARRLASLVLALLCVLVVAPPAAEAGIERYEYDPLGRLVRMIDAQGRVTEYVYDAVGNILEVRSGGTAAPPTVAAIAPGAMRRGTSATVTIDGTRLVNAQVQATDPQLQIGGVAASATRVTFELAVGTTAALGASAIFVRNAAGEASTAITVQPVLPVASIAPTPLAIPPDNVARGFTVALDHADVVDHAVNVSSDQPAIAAVSPASAVIAAGQTQATFLVTGRSGGQTVIRLSSPTLAPAAIPVFVTAEFRGISTAFSPPVGVALAASAPPPSSSRGLHSAAVGLVKGTAWIDTVPRNVSVGTAGTLAISGVGLPAAGLAITVTPSTGITLGAVSVDGDGTRASAPIAVAADAPLGPRRITVQAAGQDLIAVQPGAGVLGVLHAQPEIVSIDPIFGTAGTTLQGFLVRGRNLHDAQTLAFSGGGIVAGLAPTVSSDGTRLTTAIEIAASAAPGPRTVTVVTPTGASSAAAGAANTFTVVESVGESVPQLASAAVGVELQGGTPPPGASTRLYSRPVGVNIGSAVHAVTPSSAATGQSLTLALSGRELAGATALTLTPPDGVTVGTPVVAGDGNSVQVPLGVAADAALGVRRLRLLAGAAPIPFTAAAGDRLLITAPLPELVSIDPIVVQAGDVVGFVIRGRNLQGATQVRLTPSAGASVGTVGVNGAGDIATVVIAFDAAAAAGPRVLSVATPAGESSLAPAATNTVTVATTPVATVPSLGSVLVGVQLATTAPPQSTTTVVHSSLVGVELASGTPPPSSPVQLRTPEVGVAIGPVVTAVAPAGFAAGASGTVVVRGVALPADTAVSFEPSTGITPSGVPVVAADGSSVTQGIAVAADAPQQPRWLRLASAAAGAILFVPATVDASIAIGPGEPGIVSLSSILATQGQTIALIVRGRNFVDVVDVLAEPGSGLAFGRNPVVAADGSTVTVQVFIAADAPLGSRVIRVRTRSGISSAIAEPANTFTVYPP